MAVKPGDMFSLQYRIQTTWDGDPIDHDPACVTLTPGQDGVNLDIKAPFFNDPPNPGGKPGQPFWKLWEYEVVELFFLNDDNQYLELQFGPYGQHLTVFMNGYMNLFKQEQPMTYSAEIQGSTWQGRALVPAEYFPSRVTKFNAFAMHYAGPSRHHEALYPAPKGKREKQDFHDLELFQALNFERVLPGNASSAPSKHWQF